jgi:hypothetical protein
MSESLVIAPRFCGPSKSGNGGYVAGCLAGHVTGTAAVRLKAPPPLNTALRIETTDTGAQLLQETTVIAEARHADVDLTPPIPPTFAQAEQAAKSYVGFVRHPFPRCFVCGPKREPGDGLRIFPGAVSDGVVAAPWIPDASLADASNKVGNVYLWSALDCTSAFPVWEVPEGKAIVLGELAARIVGTVAPGEKCVAVGWRLGIDGRKRNAGSAVFSASGQLAAIARATWVEVSASAFEPEPA